MAKLQDFSKEAPYCVNSYFTGSFKRKKVPEIEKNLSIVSTDSKEYEVSTTAVYKWFYKYSRSHKGEVKQVVEFMSDTRKIQDLKVKI